MKNKSLKYLIGLMVIITTLLIIDIINNENQSGNLKDTLISTDSAKIAEITFYPKNQKNKITLKKEDEKWFVINNDKKYEADKDKIASIIHTLINLHPTQAVGNTHKDWELYGTNDTNSINVIVKNTRGRKIAHLYIGKIETTMQPQGYPYGNMQRQYSTYVRLKGDRNVYLVPQLLAIVFINDPDAYRNHTLTNFDETNIKKITINTQDTSLTLTKKTNKWYVNDILADSLKTINYLRNISHTDGWQFIDETEAKSLKSIKQLTIELDNNQKVVIKAMGDTTIKAIWSNQNPNAYFKAQGLENKFFAEPDYFIK